MEHENKSEAKYLPLLTNGKTQMGFTTKNSNKNCPIHNNRNLEQPKIVLANHNNNIGFFNSNNDPALISNNFISTRNDFLKQRNINKNDLYSTNRVGNFYNNNKFILDKKADNSNAEILNEMKTSNKFNSNSMNLSTKNNYYNTTKFNFSNRSGFNFTNFNNNKTGFNNKLALMNMKNTSMNSFNENSNSFNKYDNSSFFDKSKKYNTYHNQNSNFNISNIGSNTNLHTYNKSIMNKKNNKNKNDILSKDLNNLIKTVYDYDDDGEINSLKKAKKNLRKITEENNNASNTNLNGSSSLENSLNQKIKLSLMERYLVCTDYSMRLNYKMK